MSLSRLLSSNSNLLDAQEPEVRSKLEALFVSKPYAQEDPAGPAEAQLQNRNSVLDRKPLHNRLLHIFSATEVASAVAAMHSAAAGPLGWHKTSLRALMSEPACLERWALILSTLMADHPPQQFVSILASGKLTALSKPNGGVRPIVTRSTLVRLLAKCVLNKDQQYLTSDLAPLQAGVGMPGGAEMVVHSARELMRQHPDWVLLSVDVRNAYGSYCKKSFDIHLGKGDVLRAAEGVIQGDPISPVLFSLALQPRRRLHHRPSERRITGLCGLAQQLGISPSTSAVTLLGSPLGSEEGMRTLLQDSFRVQYHPRC
eukprot:m.67121 g.67121  ORF g.67121 m.67121 type:complete len:315 (-) comp49942_c0_seq2:307-1251(-)